MKKVILALLDNGRRYPEDHDWDIVGIYTLDQEARALEDSKAELLELVTKHSGWYYENATVTIWKVWINKPLDYTAGTKLHKLELCWTRPEDQRIYEVKNAE